MKLFRSVVAHLALLVPVALLASACGYGVLSDISQIGSIVHQGIKLYSTTEAQVERTDVNMAIAPGVTPEQLRAIKSLSVVFQEGAQLPTPGKNLAGVVEGSVATELMALGYQVVDRRQITKISNQGGLFGSTSVDAEAARKLGVDAIVFGSLSVGRESYHTYPYARDTSGDVVKSVGLQITDVTRGVILVSLTLTNRRGQSPEATGRIIAQTLRERLQGQAAAQPAPPGSAQTSPPVASEKK